MLNGLVICKLGLEHKCEVLGENQNTNLNSTCPVCWKEVQEDALKSLEKCPTLESLDLMTPRRSLSFSAVSEEATQPYHENIYRMFLRIALCVSRI